MSTRGLPLYIREIASWLFMEDWKMEIGTGARFLSFLGTGREARPSAFVI